jgi:hypothetical protein
MRKLITLPFFGLLSVKITVERISFEILFELVKKI